MYAGLDIAIAGGSNVNRDARDRLSRTMASEEQRLFEEIKNHVKGLNPGSRFIRWQEIRIKQLGFVNNVVLILSSAIIGLVVRSENLLTILEKWGVSRSYCRSCLVCSVRGFACGTSG